MTELVFIKKLEIWRDTNKENEFQSLNKLAALDPDGWDGMKHRKERVAGRTIDHLWTTDGWACQTSQFPMIGRKVKYRIMGF